MSSSILHYFPNSDLRCSHDGLAVIAKKVAKVDARKLATGEFLLFVNSSKTAFKVMTTNNIVAHYKSPSGRIDVGSFHYLPLAFSRRGFNFDDALRAKLEDDFKKRGLRIGNDD